MIQLFALRYGPNLKRIGNLMGHSGAPYAVYGHSKQAVTLRVETSRPEPAWAEMRGVLWDGTIAVNLRPEALGHRERSAVVSSKELPVGEDRLATTACA